MREIFKGLPICVEKIEEVFRSISSRVPGSTVTSSSSDSTIYFSIQLEGEVLLDLRISSAVVETYITSKLLSALRDLGLHEIYEALERHCPYVKSVSISKAHPSGSLYLMIQGDGMNVPNIRLVITKDFFDLSSSFCRISASENTCSLLIKILELGKSYFDDFLGKR